MQMQSTCARLRCRRQFHSSTRMRRWPRRRLKPAATGTARRASAAAAASAPLAMGTRAGSDALETTPPAGSGTRLRTARTPYTASPHACQALELPMWTPQTCLLQQQKKNRSDITPDPGGHRPQRPCAQGRTCAEQDQAQARALGQNRTQFGGGATTHGRRTEQAGKSVSTRTRPGAGGCTPQSTPQEGTLQQDPNTAARVPLSHKASLAVEERPHARM